VFLEGISRTGNEARRNRSYALRRPVPGNRSQCACYGSWPSHFIILWVARVAFLAGGFGILVIPLLRRRRRQWIRATGTPVKAKVIEIKHDTRVGLQTTWDAWSPWYIVAEANEGLERKAIFASHYLWANPQACFPIGCEVTVYYGSLQTSPRIPVRAGQKTSFAKSVAKKPLRGRFANSPPPSSALSLAGGERARQIGAYLR
jgi:hypothetical protein